MTEATHPHLSESALVEHAWLAHKWIRPEDLGSERHEAETRHLDACSTCATAFYKLHLERKPELPGHTILGVLGMGGMGIVFRVKDELHGRHVALKTVQSRLRGNPEAYFRFRDEAGYTARLQHPNIPQVHASGNLPDGRPYYLMQVVEGTDFATLLSGWPNRKVPLSRLVECFQQACKAVGYAHESGVTHRDLKPANIMVGAFGEVKVMDWGLVRPHSPGSAEPPAWYRAADRQATRGAIGTYAYMPPEQANAGLGGDLVRPRPESDVFALGSLLCEILTGKPVYSVAGEADHQEEIVKKAKAGDTKKGLARLASSGAPLALIRIAVGCLDFDPDKRPKTAKTLADEVADFTADQRRRQQRAQLGRVVVAAIGVAAVVLAISTVVSTAFWQDARNQRAEALAAANREQGEKERAEKEREAARRSLAKAYLAPIGTWARQDDLSGYERASFLGLAAERDTPVGLMLLEEVVRSPLAARQFQCRGKLLYHAVVGLDPTRAKEADAILSAGFRRAEPRSELRIELALALLQARPSSVDAEVLQELTNAIRERTHPGREVGLAEALEVACQRLGRQNNTAALGRAADSILAALQKEQDAQIRLHLARGLESVCDGLDANDAATRCRPATKAFAGALAAKNDRRGLLVEGLVRVCKRLPRAERVDFLRVALRRAGGDDERLVLTKTLVDRYDGLPAEVSSEVCFKLAVDVANELESSLSTRDAGKLAESLDLLCERLRDDEPAVVCKPRAERLATALTEPVQSTELFSRRVKALAGLCGWLPKAEASELCHRVTNCLAARAAAEKDANLRRASAGGVAELAGWLSETDAADLCQRAAESFVMGFTSDDADVLGELCEYLSTTAAADVCRSASRALIVRLRLETFLQTIEAAVCRSAGEVLIGTLTSITSEDGRRDIAHALRRVCHYLPVAEVAERVREASGMAKYEVEQFRYSEILADESTRLPAEEATTALVECLIGTKKPDFCYHLSRALKSACGRMTEAEADAVCRPLVKRLTGAFDAHEDPDHRVWIVDALVTVCGRLTADEAADQCRPVARKVATLIDVNQAPAHYHQMLADVCGRLPADEAADHCRPVARRLAKDLSAQREAERQAAIASFLALFCDHLAADEAVDLVLTSLKTVANGRARANLLPVIVKQTAKLPPEVATKARMSAVDYMTESLTSLYGPDRTDAVRMIAYLCLHLPIADAGDRLIATLWGLTQWSWRREVEVISQALTSVHRRLTPGHALHLSLNPLGHMLPGLAIIPTLGGLTGRGCDPQWLVDLLKQPFCVNAAQRVILDMLEEYYGCDFADIWAFVEFATTNAPELDLYSLPTFKKQ